MPLSGFKRGLIFLVSLASPIIFTGLQPKSLRLVEIISEVKGDLYSETKVGPWFDSWRMREGAGTGDMSYSYGYVVRMAGSENAIKEKRTVTNKTYDTKAPVSGELTLIETKLNRGGKRGRLVGKSEIEAIIGGYTKKKFLLIGVGRESNEVEFNGLVSIVTANNGSKKCKDTIQAKDVTFKSDGKSMNDAFGDKIKPQLQNTSLLSANALSLSGMWAYGNCNKEFYKSKDESELEVVEKLTQDEQQIGLQELNIEGGMFIIQVLGMKHKKIRDIIGPGILGKNVTGNGKGVTLWAGRQSDGIVQKEGGTGETRKSGQGSILLHDWRSSETTYDEGELQKVAKEHQESGIAKIQLNKDRRYYLWDPSYTKIEGGELITKDNKKIPWKININMPFTFTLIK